MKVDSPIAPDGAKLPPTFSASQIGSYLDCPRKWAWDRIAKIPRSTHPSAAKGTHTHSHLERWLKSSTQPTFSREDGTPDEPGELAQAVIDADCSPPPGTPGLQIEHSFLFESPRTHFLYRGFIDWRVPNWPEKIPTVGDWKTTSDIRKYAKTAEQLLTDPQAILYSVETMATYHAPVVRLQWTYVQTRGARKVLPVVQEMTSAHVASAFEVIEEVTMEMAGLLSSVSKDEIKDKISPVTSHCDAYGGCPYRGACNLSPEERMREIWRAADKTYGVSE